MDPLPNIGPEAFCSFPIHAREAGNFWKESVDSDPFRASRKKLGRPATLTPVYRPDIDGLRAISILLVVAFHACPAIVTGGFIGVDVFFVISGFLITGIILRQTAAGTFSLATFYSRRVRRIFPALIMVMAITYVIGWVVLLPRDFAMLGDNMVAGTAFASNLFQLRSLDYFAPDAAFNPLLHLWSLGIEEQFYIFWPIILVLLKPGRPVLVAICGIGMASFAINLAYVWGHHAQAAFYSPQARAWELLAGAALAYRQVSGIRPLLPFSPDARGFLGLMLIAAAALLLNAKSAFPGWNALLPVTGAVLLISAHGSRISAVLSSRPLVATGLISYPLYLWHWPLLSYLATIRGSDPTALEVLFTVCAAFVLSYVTYKLLELTARQCRSAILPRSASLAAAAVLGLVTTLSSGFSSRFSEEIREIAESKPMENVGLRKPCLLASTDDASAISTTCIAGGDAPLLVLWGDSTAAALQPGLKQAQQTTSFRLAQLTASSCPPLLHANISGDSNCKGVNDSFLELVAMHHPDIVLLHSLWSTDNDPTRLRDTVKALKALNVPRVIVLGPVPNWKRGLPNALLNYYRMHQTIPDRLAKGFSGQDRDQQMAGISRQLGVEYISAWDAFCNMQGCMARSAANGNGTFFVDTVHLSTSGSKYLIDAIRKPLFGDADRPAAIR